MPSTMITSSESTRITLPHCKGGIEYSVVYDTSNRYDKRYGTLNNNVKFESLDKLPVDKRFHKFTCNCYKCKKK